jgi:hypothetical protein
VRTATGAGSARDVLGGSGDIEADINADMVEKMMCASEELAEGQMMEGEMEGAKILLLRCNTVKS